MKSDCGTAQHLDYKTGPLSHDCVTIIQLFLALKKTIISVKLVMVITPFLKMQKDKYSSRDTIVIVLAWVMALSLVYVAYVKFKLLFQ
jgi:hypothetical protein